VNRRLAILISGRGSNLQSILDATQSGSLDAKVAVVVSNRADAGGLARAREAGVEALHVSPRDFADRDGYDRELVKILRARHVGGDSAVELQARAVRDRGPEPL